MKYRRKSNLNRYLFCFDGAILSINQSHSKAEQFRKWYQSNSTIIPKALDNVVVNFLRKYESIKDKK